MNTRNIILLSTYEEEAIPKKLISHFDMNIFQKVVWILSQLIAFNLKLQQKNLRGQKSIVWKTALGYLNI